MKTNPTQFNEQGAGRGGGRGFRRRTLGLAPSLSAGQLAIPEAGPGWEGATADIHLVNDRTAHSTWMLMRGSLQGLTWPFA